MVATYQKNRGIIFNYTFFGGKDLDFVAAEDYTMWVYFEKKKSILIIQNLGPLPRLWKATMLIRDPKA